MKMCFRVGGYETNKTGTSQVGPIPKAQIKSKGDPLETKNLEKKVAQCRKKNQKGEPFSHVRFGRLRLKIKKPKRGPFGDKKIRKKSQCRKQSKWVTF